MQAVFTDLPYETWQEWFLCFPQSPWIFSTRNSPWRDIINYHFNAAGLCSNILHPNWPIFSRKTNDPGALKIKFVDDIFITTKINFKKNIIKDKDRQKPLPFDKRQETKLIETNMLKQIIDNLNSFAMEPQINMNSGKSAVMKICKSKTKAFPVEIKIGNPLLEVKKELIILGVILTPNLKWF